VKHACYFGRVYALEGILRRVYYPFLGKLTIAKGRNVSVKLIGWLSVEVWFSKPPLIAAMLYQKSYS